jgi:glycosyltransferase involved in cell wall biosynthesis
MSGENQVKKFFAPEVRSQVHVFPFVKREDMPTVYAQHDILVFPSLVEGMPLTLLEAMASGMPVVTTDTCGMSDVVEDRFNGLLVPPADAAAIASAIEQLYSSAEFQKRIGQQARETVRRYTWDKVTQNLERVLALTVQDGQN